MIPRRPVTKAVAALLAAATGKPCGIGSVPLDASGHPVDPPYNLLYSLDAYRGGAPFADRHEDASFVYQVTSVSGPDLDDPNSRGGMEQLEWLADKTTAALLGRDPVTGQWTHPLTVPGATNTGRAVDTEAGATSEPSDAIMTYVIRVRLDWTSTA